jgi:hypothetical protein
VYLTELSHRQIPARVGFAAGERYEQQPVELLSAACAVYNPAPVPALQSVTPNTETKRGNYPPKCLARLVVRPKMRVVNKRDVDRL